jgi:hypothetical protein
MENIFNIIIQFIVEITIGVFSKKDLSELKCSSCFINKFLSNSDQNKKRNKKYYWQLQMKYITFLIKSIFGFTVGITGYFVVHKNNYLHEIFIITMYILSWLLIFVSLKEFIKGIIIRKKIERLY